ncbi:MAG: AAA family ATPase [Hominilimicola sp.]|uniref:AAA family ATPase n=1 Tax=Hominilimicola sp. TaxID=3073571 RepID=UPI00399AA6AB
MNDYNLTEILEYIDPSTCSYQEWINVGMALKHEGYTVSDWDMWSMKDVNRYHSGECAKKWATFQGSSAPVTAGTIIQMAKENGYHYENVSAELDWDSEIGSKDELIVVDRNWLERSEIHIPEQWNPTEQIITYLETLFEPDENVGYVTESWEHDGKFLPSKGCYDRTAGQLIKELYQCKGDIGSVLGDYNSEVGAWIRFNPLDGKGVKNENVTEFRYALVESDTMDISAQKAIITELELPVAALVYSGKKSLHAIVKIDASTYEEYKKRVDYLYNVCNKNGLKLDIQNRNPSRLSRMPGIMRNGKKQYLLDTNIGKENWNEWREWIESVNDDLPDPESMADVWDNLPELAPPLIDGVLRQGHKMLIAGPSKAGKSYALIELCCAIAEGEKWLEWNCTQGRVMYVNLELDRASCLHRFKDVYTALGIAPDNLSNIDIWNLRGRSVPMDKLAPKLIRRASKKNYIAIIIDPIYKVITGDENSADQMAHFCNQFDKVCTELGCAVIYCHHHSKGAQGGKRSMDRASGSGVFARDPDALIDLVELELNDDILKQEKNKAVCKVCEGWLYKYDKLYHASQDDLCSETQMLALCREYLENDAYECVIEDVGKARKSVESRSAWRIEGTLREFPKFAPVNLWFKYPVHNIDNIGVLKDIAVDDGMPMWKKNFSKKKTDAERKTERKNSLETAFEACGIDDKVTVKSMAEYMGVTEKTVRNRLKEHGGFWIDEGQVGKK